MATALAVFVAAMIAYALEGFIGYVKSRDV